MRILDPFQKKELEKKIGRPLTPGEVEQALEHELTFLVQEDGEIYFLAKDELEVVYLPQDVV